MNKQEIEKGCVVEVMNNHRKGFESEALSQEEVESLTELSRLCKGDILKMTSIAGSGHPGGSISSLDIYLVLYSYARVYPNEPEKPDRDRIVISHGHTSPAVYAVLARLGFFSLEEAIATFRKGGSLFEGHVERTIPGIEWTTGNLGQGLSAGCGFALASKLTNTPFNVYVVMSDAEQAKGQVAEARRFAKKFDLNNITVIIDYNELQISGSVHEIMPVNIIENYLSDGWDILEINGHNYQEIYQALRKATRSPRLTAILAHTIMGKGVSFMESDEKYHGRALKEDEIQKALRELRVENDREKHRIRRDTFRITNHAPLLPKYKPVVDKGVPFIYTPEDKVDNRAAFGRALRNLGERNCGVKGKTPIAVFDCDLAESVRTIWFAKDFPKFFFQCGVAEHNCATVAGALSTQGVISIFADFGVFGIDEAYNQHRLNDINGSNLKLILTHLGLDVGQDGKTHHCIDYIGLLRNLYGFKLILPADANQMDKVVRFVVSEYGNYVIGMGRSSQPIILKENGGIFFGEEYSFEYGKADTVREGEMATIISYGQMLHRAIKAWEILSKKGIKVQVINLSTPLDPDEEALKEASFKGPVIVYEDHNVNSGLGSIIADKALQLGLPLKLKKLGIKRYASSGRPDELYDIEGLSVESLVKAVEEALSE